MNNVNKSKLGQVSFRIYQHHLDLLKNLSEKIGCNRTKIIEYIIEVIATLPESELIELAEDFRLIEDHYEKSKNAAFKRIAFKNLRNNE
ncbi:MAG: hypothetical protein CMM02_05300 [Rhodopirellula sp.]|jgi:predicted DNA-binding protein|nr:hypothetical protein [Rhodopirellula sp.]|tara:strand:- start:5320 stop:5586 length:267 start_codon:yes stop_codon:yes gene_type:complete